MTEPLLPALDSRSNRRRVARFALASAGGALLTLGALRTGRLAIAQSGDEDDDNSGRGRGRGRGGDNSGPGNAEDRAEAAELQAEIPPGSLEVRIVSDDAGGFVPAELTVDLGQSVTFVNAHSDEHTATGSGFDTGIIPEGSVATVVLDTPGVFRYACQIHPEMTGRIDVRDETGVVPQATPAPAPAGAESVSIANLSFNPVDLVVPVGATVTWRNEDAVPHTVTANDGSFDSGIFDPGASFSQTFDRPGEFPYHCQLHPTMRGTIRVGDETGAVAAQAAAAPAAEPAAQATPVAEGATVSIVDFAFEPQELRIAAGTTVVWTNSGAAPHTVTGDWASSDILQPGQTFSHTFDAEGRFAYICAIHPEMTGEVVVGPPAVAEAEPEAAISPQPSGVWRLELVPEDLATFGAYLAIVAMRADGTLAADFVSVTATVPPAVPTSGHGEWELQGDQLRISLVTLLEDESRRFAGTVAIESHAQIADDGQSLEGTFAFTVSAANGETSSQGVGTVRGERVPLASR